ncbi:MAG TPA: glycosyl hydrolase, partial [Chitinophagaceae bacterium]|nr:glycosyl hydrolase [Chitinophagaceae bacterium]
LSSLGDVKKAIDLYFLAGVNHIFYHGTAYSPKDAPWPGWLFYAAVHFQPTNPQWKDFHVLNEYITRVQSFLQNSKSNNDILLYYPIADRYSQPGVSMGPLLQHFDGMERNFEKTDFEHISRWLLDNGYSFDFFSDRQLQSFSVQNERVLTGGNRYRTILLPGNKLIPEASFQKLVALARDGATILVYNELPDDVPGLALHDKRRELLTKAIDQLHLKRYSDSAQGAEVGKGAFYISLDLRGLLMLGSARHSDANTGLSILHRVNNDGQVYFVNNRSDKAIDQWVKFQGTGKVPAALFDPMTGHYGMAKSRYDNQGNLDIWLQLQPYESIIIQTFVKPAKAKPYAYVTTTGNPIPVNGPWRILFLDGGPSLPDQYMFDPLRSWDELRDEKAKNFSGTARYYCEFETAKESMTDYLLDLGIVHETAEVFVNGKKIATLIGPTFQCVIPASALQPTNKLEIIVANLMANRIAYMDRNNIPWKIFYNTNMPARKRENIKNGLFNASDWKPLPSGLLGPVTLTPARIE